MYLKFGGIPRAFLVNVVSSKRLRLQACVSVDISHARYPQLWPTFWPHLVSDVNCHDVSNATAEAEFYACNPDISKHQPFFKWSLFCWCTITFLPVYISREIEYNWNTCYRHRPLWYDAMARFNQLDKLSVGIITWIWYSWHANSCQAKPR